MTLVAELAGHLAVAPAHPAVPHHPGHLVVTLVAELAGHLAVAPAHPAVPHHPGHLATLLWLLPTLL